MPHHNLKCIEPFFTDICRGLKRFEVRKDDRTPAFKDGDTACFQLYDPKTKRLDGIQINVDIGYVLRDSPYLKKGYCAFGIELRQTSI